MEHNMVQFDILLICIILCIKNMYSIGGVMGKTTVDLSDELIEKALAVTGCRTKKEVIEEGLREIVRKKSRELLRKELGTYEIDLTPQELIRIRESE